MKVNSAVHVPTALAIIIALSVSGHGQETNTDEMVQLTHDDFRNVIVGHTLVHELAGVERHEFFAADGTVHGHERFQPYTGSWMLSGPSRWNFTERNCVVLTAADVRARCWTFLHDVGDDIYYIGTKTRNRYYYVGTRTENEYVFLTELRILDGRAL